jgi:hypothetical protein
MSIDPRFEWLLSFRAVSRKPFGHFLDLKGRMTEGRSTFGTASDPSFGPDFVYDEADDNVLFNFVGLRVWKHKIKI